MSLFKRRIPSKHGTLPPGTRACPMSPSTTLTSSGIPSLDDILGGGVPLSCSVALLAPDPHSAYGELVAKYFVAQGIASGHKVCIVHEDAPSFVKECMWMPSTSQNKPSPTVVDEDDVVQSGDKVKIAWRYEQMKKFQTTVSDISADDFCGAFDLTCRIPMSVIDAAYDADLFIPLNLTIDDDLASSMGELLKQIKHAFATIPSTQVVRLCITALGSPAWGEHCRADILRFLYALRRLLHQHPHACACVSLAPHFCTDGLAGSVWAQKVGWATDATLLMSGFGANPALTTLFPSHHGLVQIDRLPTPHSTLPTSDRFSTLRGLSSSAAASAGTGENNLAFKCTRKRLVFETMHLDSEGGVAERRTMPPSTAVDSDVLPIHTHVSDKGNTAQLASVPVVLEATTADMKSQSLESRVFQNAEPATSVVPPKAKKAKKKVAFHSDKPDLYDF